MATDMQKWIGRTARLEEEVKGLAGGPQLAKSSIENGAVLEYDETGQLVSSIGKQYDGSHVAVPLAGPVPPVPMPPTCQSAPGVIEARASGKFEGDAVSTLDWSHFAAYVGDTIDFEPDWSKQEATIRGELGDVALFARPAGTYYVRLASWSRTGKHSEASAAVEVIVPEVADGDAIADALDQMDLSIAAVQDAVNGVNKVINATTEPDADGGSTGDRWQQWTTLELGGKLLKAWRWDGTTWIPELMDPSYLPLVDIGQGTFGTLSGGRLEPNSVLAKSIAVGDFTNYATIDPVRGTNVSVPPKWATITDAGYTKSAPSSENYIMFKDQTDTVPFKAGETLLLKFDAVATATATVIPRILGYSQPAAANGAGYLGNASGPAFDIGTTEQAYSATLTATAGITATAKSWILGIGGTASIKGVRVRNVRVTRMMGGELIVDGAITASKITASEELTAKVAQFLTVKADMIEANAIDGMVITGAVIQSPGLGAGYQLTENGYTSRDADGSVTVRLPSDGSPAQFRGDVEAQSMTASGRVSLQAPENEIASGASLILESGVQEPASPPSVGTSYGIVQFSKPPEDSATMYGLAYADGLWWRAVDAGAGLDSLDRFEGLDSAGTVVRSFPLTQFWARNGVTAIGGELYFLGRRDDLPAATRDKSRWVRVFGTDGAFKRMWEYTGYGLGDYQPGIGTDGANVLIAQSDSLGRVRWRIIDRTTGAVLSYVESDYVAKDAFVGAYKGTADLGATRVFLTKAAGTTEAFTVDGVNAGRIGSWYSANNEAAVGLAWAGGRFVQLSRSGRLVNYSGFTNADGDTNDWWAAQTWVGPSGEETTIGPAQRFTYTRRSELQLSGSQMPPGVTGARFYLARKSTNPTRTDYHLVTSTVGAAGRLATLPSNWGTLANPPSTSTFPDTSPGAVTSRLGTFEVRGDGSGQWGPLVFNADGTMSSSAVPDWIPVTNFAAGFGAATFGDVPAYRVWPDGKVEWRGVVSGTMTGTMKILTMPTGAKPTVPKNKVAATNTLSGRDAVMRIEFGPTVDTLALNVYTSGANRTWVSLDELYYYRA